MHRACYLLILVVLSAGCVTPGYRAAVGNFATATSTVAGAVQTQLSQADAQAREQAIYAGFGEFEVLSELAPPSLAALQTRGPLPDDQRRIRATAMTVLQRYASLLQQLAMSEDPKDARAASRRLSDSAADLSTSIGEALGETQDPHFAAFAGPAGALFSEVLEAALDVAIRKALDRAITGGEEAIDGLCGAMARDLTALHADRKAWLSARRNALNTALLQAVEVAKTDATALLDVIELTERVVAAQDRLTLWSAVNPSEAPDALKTAHAKLREYARGGHKTEALTAVGTAVYALGNAAYTLVDAILATAPMGNNDPTRSLP